MPAARDPAPGPAPDPSRPARRVTVDPYGPVLVEGPVEVVLADGTVARSDRFVVALCTCRRSRTPPWCDTSHRPRRRDAAAPAPEAPAGQAPAPDAPAPDDRSDP
ncbi:CDGSH iron-sulfur domain-containing protein [Streptomyces sp. NPDC032472]|uniref:CDGSH iron-sulfur domain-containing protein n=1 Tax=Streptomyces sp. NPDC032472 TaxID=3155018 RepID=UPI0033D114C5